MKKIRCGENQVPRTEEVCTVPKAVWKIFKPRNLPSQDGDSAGSLLENFYSATSKE
jgi:hypothetical protein